MEHSSEKFRFQNPEKLRFQSFRLEKRKFLFYPKKTKNFIGSNSTEVGKLQEIGFKFFSKKPFVPILKHSSRIRRSKTGMVTEFFPAN